MREPAPLSHPFFFANARYPALGGNLTPTYSTHISFRSCANATRTSGIYTLSSRVFQAPTMTLGQSRSTCRARFGKTTWISTGGFTRDSSIKHPDEQGELIVSERLLHIKHALGSCHFPASVLCSIECHPH